MTIAEFNAARARQLLLELLPIPGRSGEELAVADYIRDKLRDAGCPADAIATDSVWRRTPVTGNVGNLIVKLPGTIRAPRRMLVAHLDTVPICVGSKPVVRGDTIVSGNPESGLGADNRAGCGVLLATALELLQSGRPHPPLTFLWTVQEETGLHGARLVSPAALGKPKLAFNFDGSSPDKITTGATGGYRTTITVRGLASHAGGAPEKGVSAIAIAALAVAELHNEGWHGAICKPIGKTGKRGNRLGTSNVGVIHGGAATNVVADEVTIRAEARSHDARFREEIVKQIERAFERAAKSVKNSEGRCGSVSFAGRLDYEAFHLAADEPCVRLATEAVAALGREPQRFISNGGLDANWLTAHGIPTVTLGCGQINQHQKAEALSLPDYLDACRAALRLATGT